MVVPAPQTRQWDAGLVCESAVLLKDEELSLQLTSGTRICELVCKVEEDILSKFCDTINNRLNMCGTLTRQDFIIVYEQFVSFWNLHLTR